MGEATALALGAKLVQALQIPPCTFLSDSQQLVQFLHSANREHSPHWRMKPYTQTYANVAGTIFWHSLQDQQNSKLYSRYSFFLFLDQRPIGPAFYRKQKVLLG